MDFKATVTVKIIIKNAVQRLGNEANSILYL